MVTRQITLKGGVFTVMWPVWSFVYDSISETVQDRDMIAIED